MAVRLPQRNEQRLTHAAAQRGIATPSLGDLYHSTPRTEGWRLGFAALTPQAIEESVSALSTVQVHRYNRG